MLGSLTPCLKGSGFEPGPFRLGVAERTFSADHTGWSGGGTADVGNADVGNADVGTADI